MEMELGGRLLSSMIGYLFGSFLTAQLVAWLAERKDPGEIGSGNPGMANIMANVGKKAGFAVLAGDLLKTLLACLLAVWLTADEIGNSTAVLYAGVGAVLGHNYPLWRAGRGGKGVTVTCGWLVLYLGSAGAVCCILGGIAVLIWGYLPLGAVVISVAAIPVAWIRQGTEGGLWMAVAAVIMFSRHAEGLRGMVCGTEKQVFRKKDRK